MSKCFTLFPWCEQRCNRLKKVKQYQEDIEMGHYKRYNRFTKVSKVVRNGKKDSELETELKACVHIKMMYSNLVKATFL